MRKKRHKPGVVRRQELISKGIGGRTGNPEMGGLERPCPGGEGARAIILSSFPQMTGEQVHSWPCAKAHREIDIELGLNADLLWQKEGGHSYSEVQKKPERAWSSPRELRVRWPLPSPSLAWVSCGSGFRATCQCVSVGADSFGHLGI